MLKKGMEGDLLTDDWVLLHQLADSLDKCEQKVLDKFGYMIQEYQVFRALKHLKGNITPTKITNYLDKNRNYITFIIDRMEKRGLVQRIRDMDDRRSLRLVITPEGEKQYKKLIGPAEELPKELLSVLTQKEILALGKILNKLIMKTYKYRKVNNKGILDLDA